MRSPPSPSCRCSQVLSAKHVVADLTLGLGTVVHDYLAPGAAGDARTGSEILIEANAG